MKKFLKNYIFEIFFFIIGILITPFFIQYSLIRIILLVTVCATFIFFIVDLFLNEFNNYNIILILNKIFYIYCPLLIYQLFNDTGLSVFQESVFILLPIILSILAWLIICVIFELNDIDYLLDVIQVVIIFMTVGLFLSYAWSIIKSINDVGFNNLIILRLVICLFSLFFLCIILYSRNLSKKNKNIPISFISLSAIASLVVIVFLVWYNLEYDIVDNYGLFNIYFRFILITSFFIFFILLNNFKTKYYDTLKLNNISKKILILYSILLTYSIFVEIAKNYLPDFINAIFSKPETIVSLFITTIIASVISGLITNKLINKEKKYNKSEYKTNPYILELDDNPDKIVTKEIESENKTEKEQ